jgi:hypothetical protein
MSKKTYCPPLEPDIFDEKVRTERLSPIIKVDSQDPGIGYFKGPNSTLQTRLRHTSCLSCQHCAFSHDSAGCAIQGCPCLLQRSLGTIGFEDRNSDLQGLPRSHTKKDWGDLQGKPSAGRRSPAKPKRDLDPLQGHPWKRTLGKPDRKKRWLGARSRSSSDLPRTRTQE